MTWFICIVHGVHAVDCNIDEVSKITVIQHVAELAAAPSEAEPVILVETRTMAGVPIEVSRASAPTGEACCMDRHDTVSLVVTSVGPKPQLEITEVIAPVPIHPAGSDMNDGGAILVEPHAEEPGHVGDESQRPTCVSEVDDLATPSRRRLEGDQFGFHPADVGLILTHFALSPNSCILTAGR